MPKYALWCVFVYVIILLYIVYMSIQDKVINIWLANPWTKKWERMGLCTSKPTCIHQYLYCNSLGLHNLKLQLLLYWLYSYSTIAPSVGILQYYSPTVSNLTFYLEICSKLQGSAALKVSHSSSKFSCIYSHIKG